MVNGAARNIGTVTVGNSGLHLWSAVTGAGGMLDLAAAASRGQTVDFLIFGILRLDDGRTSMAGSAASARATRSLTGFAAEAVVR